MALEEIGVALSIEGVPIIKRDLDTLQNSAKTTGQALAALKQITNSLSGMSLPGNLKSELDRITGALNNLKNLKGTASSIFAGIGSGASSIRIATREVNNLATGLANIEIATGRALPKAVGAVGALRGEIKKVATVLATSEIAHLNKLGDDKLVSQMNRFGASLSSIKDAPGITAARKEIDKIALGFANAEIASGRAIPGAVNAVASLRKEIEKTALSLANKEIANLPFNLVKSVAPAKQLSQGIIEVGAGYKNYISAATYSAPLMRAQVAAFQEITGSATPLNNILRTSGQEILKTSRIGRIWATQLGDMASQVSKASGQARGYAEIQKYLNNVSSLAPVNMAKQVAAFQGGVKGAQNFYKASNTLTGAMLQLHQRTQGYYAAMGRGQIPMAQMIAGFNASSLMSRAFGASLANLGNRVLNLRNALAFVITMEALRGLKNYIDSWIGYENSIRLSTRSTEEAAVVQERLFEIAQKTRMAMDTAVPLYRRLAQAQGSLGASQNEMLQVTENVGKAIAIQGTSVEAARGALLQFGQLLGMARVRAQEFNSINENTPRILQAVATHFEAAGGSIHKLRELVVKGKVSNQDFFRAFLAATQELDAEFKKVTPTIGQAFTVLDNAIGRFIHSLDKATGGSRLFAEAIMWIGNNLPLVVTAIEAIVASLLILSAPYIWMKIKLGFDSLMMAAGPAGWAYKLATVIGIAAIALVNFGDKIKVASVRYETLVNQTKNPLKVNWNDATQPKVLAPEGALRQVDVGVMDTLRSIRDEIFKIVGEIWDYITNIFSNVWRGIFNSLVPILTLIDAEWVKTLDNVGNNIFSAIGNPFEAVFNYIKNELNELIGNFAGFAAMVKAIFDGLAKTIEGAIKDLRTLKSSPWRLFSGPPPETTKAGVKALVDGAKEFDRAKKEMIKSDPVGSSLNRVRLGAEKYALGRQPGSANLDTKGDPDTKGNTDAIDKLRKAYENLKASFNSIYAAQLHVARGQKIIDDALAAGIIKTDEAVESRRQLNQHYQDALDPVGATIRKMQEEIDVINQLKVDRQADVELLKLQRKWTKDNVPVTEEQIQKYKETSRTLRQLQADAQAYQHMYDKFKRPLQEMNSGERALNTLLREGTIEIGEYRQALAELKMSAGKGGWEDGLIVGLNVLDARVTNWVGRIGELFGQVTDALASGVGEAFGRALTSAEDFRDILGDISRQILSTLIAALVKLGIQMGMNAILGATLGAASTAAAVTEAGVVLAAATPAAYAMNVATLGGASAIGTATYITGLASAKAAGAGLALLKTGGYTGNASRDDIVGMVHGQEFVVNADGTKKNRALLESINRGATPGGGGRSSMPGGAPVVNISVQNHSTAGIEVQQISPTDIRIIARQEAQRAVEQDAPRVVAAQMRDPNSRVSKSLGQSTRTSRRR